MRRYAPMNRAVNKLLASYTDDQLETIADFLKRTVEAGRAATDELAATAPS
jgi:hypothetical protein